MNLADCGQCHTDTWFGSGQSFVISLVFLMVTTITMPFNDLKQIGKFMLLVKCFCKWKKYSYHWPWKIGNGRRHAKSLPKYFCFHWIDFIFIYWRIRIFPPNIEFHILIWISRRKNPLRFATILFSIQINSYRIFNNRHNHFFPRVFSFFFRWPLFERSKTKTKINKQITNRFTKQTTSRSKNEQ